MPHYSLRSSDLYFRLEIRLLHCMKSLPHGYANYCFPFFALAFLIAQRWHTPLECKQKITVDSAVLAYPGDGSRKNIQLHGSEDLRVDVGTAEVSTNDLDAGSSTFTAVMVELQE